MNPEWTLFGILLAITVGLLLRGGRHSRGLYLLIASLGIGALLAAYGWHVITSKKEIARERLERSAPSEGGPSGYVSSDQCRACHPSEYESWHRTYHRTMTQLATPESVVGDFNGVQLEFLGKQYELEQRGDEFWVEMDDPNWQPPTSNPQASPKRVQRQIALLTGSHSMQVYWVPEEKGNLQTVFPFAWLIEDKRWAPFIRTFLRDSKMAPPNQNWNLNCIDCHATQGQARPNPRTTSFETRTGELGISCEACHGPGKTHVTHHRSITQRYLQHMSDTPDDTIINPAKLSAERSSEACGQCHGIKWIPNRKDHLQYGARFRPGQELAKTEPLVRPTRLDEQPWLSGPLQQNPTYLRDHYWSDGMVRVSGREYSGMIEAPCHQRGALSCISCHSMHHSDPNDQLAQDMETNAACTQCHEDIEKNLEQHTHHAPESSGSLCYNCHMPHTTYGLLKAIRSHQIDVPTVRATVETGRPNACNLCHLDKTLEWTGNHLSEWYAQPKETISEEQRHISATILGTLKGDAGQRALVAWAMGWKEAQEVSGTDWLAPYLGELMDDPYSAVRYIAHRSIKTLDGGYKDVPYDFVQPESARREAKEKIMNLWEAQSETDDERPSLLILDGGLHQPSFEYFLKGRNNMSMDLQE